MSVRLENAVPAGLLFLPWKGRGTSQRLVEGYWPQTTPPAATTPPPLLRNGPPPPPGEE